MGVLSPMALHNGSDAGKRGVTSTNAIAVSIAVVVLLGCVFMMAPTSSIGSSNRLRMRLNFNTGSGEASWEAVGDEEQMKKIVAALGAGLEQPKAVTLPDEAEVAATVAVLEAAGEANAEEQSQVTQQLDTQAQPAVQPQNMSARQQEQPQHPSAAAEEQGADEADSEALGQEYANRFKNCDNEGQFACLTRQADTKLGTSGGKRQFRFPHFYIVGFQKCATTSLFHHLADHPQIERASNKEPEFFTKQCNYNAMRCVASQQRKYMRDILMFRNVTANNFTKAAFEGSTHYGLEGRWLAMQLKEHFPWIKIVVSMREPISQAISMLRHQLDHDRVPDCYDVKQGLAFPCVIEDLDYESRYARSLAPWLKHIPRQQLHVLQYENLTSKAYMSPALRELKSFLEIDPSLPSDDLGMFNFRHQRKDDYHEGWKMTRSEYEQLVTKARRNAEEIAEIVRQQGFGDGDGWLQNWEDAWKTNLEERCGPGPDDECLVLLT